MQALLDDRAVIALSGPDARELLQGLITNDIESLAPGRALYAALLTPQGKILFDFLIAEGDGAVLLDCVAETAEALVKRLAMYRLRAKVEIARRDRLTVMAAWNGERLPESAIAFADPRLPALGRRAIAAAAEIPASAQTADAYREYRLGLGVPEGEDFGHDTMFALDANLEELNGVDFKKGCYVGQELTARMKHRGSARKRLLPIATVAGGPLPASGTSVIGSGKSIGEIVSTYGARGFALIRLDRLEETGQSPPSADGIPVKLSRPQWLCP